MACRSEILSCNDALRVRQNALTDIDPDVSAILRHSPRRRLTE